MPRTNIAVLGFVSAILSMVNADTPFQPTISGAQKGATIRGLLRRQETCDLGYGLCSNTGVCCPLGGDCCSDGNCCGAGDYCGIADNGIIGCCPNGEVCSGSVSGHTTTIEQVPTLTSTTILLPTTSTLTSQLTATSTRSTISSLSLPSSRSTISSQTSRINTASPTFYAPQSTPAPDSGYRNVFVPGNSAQITWSSEWIDSGSSCDSTKVCMSTSTFSSLTYMASSSSSGGALYLDVSYELTDFDIYINGQLSNIISFDVETCDFYYIGNLPTTQNAINITIDIIGPARSGRRQADFGSFEFNGFMVGQKTTNAASRLEHAGMIAIFPMLLAVIILL